MNDHNIMIVDDDPHLREIVRFALEKAGFPTFQATNGKEALSLFAERKPSLIILDIMMPEMDGTEVCREIRKRSDVPIIFLTSKDEEIDRVLGLELGGDDYVPKPFSPRELTARVKAVLRRISPRREQEAAGERKTLAYHKLSLDLDTCTAGWEDQRIVLTVIEFGLLRALMGYPEKVYSRDELMQRAYDDNTVVSGRTIDSHIRRIRTKFSAVGGDPIVTMHGFGYKLAPCR